MNVYVPTMAREHVTELSPVSFEITVKLQIEVMSKPVEVVIERLIVSQDDVTNEEIGIVISVVFCKLDTRMSGF